MVGNALEVDRVGAADHQPGGDHGAREQLAHGALDQAVRVARSRRHFRRLGRTRQCKDLEAVIVDGLLDMRQHRLAGVAWQQPKVDRRLGATRQHIFFVTGVDDRQRSRGPQHRVGAGAGLQLLLHQRAKEPEIGHRDARQAAHLRRHRFEHFARDAADAGGQLFIVHPLQRGAHHGDRARALGRWHRRMSGCRRYPQHH